MALSIGENLVDLAGTDLGLLDGKKALITGSRRGIGAGIALRSQPRARTSA